MAKIHINNPKQVINGGAKKYYFKVKGLGGPKGDKGDTGATGPQGPQGPQGNAATVSVGSTTTLPVGQDATVQNVGTLYNAVLNFGIPQGPRGPQGATGATGAKGDKGDQGNPGPQGEKGTNATVYIGTTSTLNPGSQATVYNSGTDSNAVLNFGIPKGEKGDTGPMPTIAQTTGQAADQVMSQKATTDALNTKQGTISSSNKLSADLVTDTSTTNKFVTAEDKTTWNAKQDALTAGTGIGITGGVISTPAIVPEVVTELPTTGAEGKLYLTPKAHTTSTATGNPIEATITAQAGQLESFQLDGDTFQQSYTGKNLLEPKMATATFNGVTCTNNGDGSFTLNGTANGTASFRLDQSSYGSGDNLKTYSGTYTLSCDELEDGMDLVLMQINTWQMYLRMRNSNTPVTAAIDATNSFIYVAVSNGKTVTNLTIHPMFEKSATATSYEPYCGGVPSPNPDYPQAIQTVTGEQTVSINDTDYTIDLGSIELCKLGTYQDYIWKDGDDWKIHKTIGKTKLEDTIPQTTWSFYAGGKFYATQSELYSRLGMTGRELKCNCLYYWNSTSATWDTDYRIGINEGFVFWLTIGDTTVTTNSGLKDWFTAHNATIYYPLANATDTTITDTTLIAQLEAIRTASLENGTNTITNTATGTNLAGDMEIGYYGFNPTNRYDKFIWLDLNNNYEQIGGE